MKLVKINKIGEKSIIEINKIDEKINKINKFDEPIKSIKTIEVYFTGYAIKSVLYRLTELLCTDYVLWHCSTRLQ